MSSVGLARQADRKRPSPAAHAAAVILLTCLYNLSTSTVGVVRLTQGTPPPQPRRSDILDGEAPRGPLSEGGSIQWPKKIIPQPRQIVLARLDVAVAHASRTGPTRPPFPGRVQDASSCICYIVRFAYTHLTYSQHQILQPILYHAFLPLCICAARTQGDAPSPVHPARGTLVGAEISHDLLVTRDKNGAVGSLLGAMPRRLRLAHPMYSHQSGPPAAHARGVGYLCRAHEWKDCGARRCRKILRSHLYYKYMIVAQGPSVIHLPHTLVHLLSSSLGTLCLLLLRFRFPRTPFLFLIQLPFA